MVVLTDIIVDTSELIWVKLGFYEWKNRKFSLSSDDSDDRKFHTSICKRSVAMRFKAVLSKTTTQSAQLVNRFSVSIELYG